MRGHWKRWLAGAALLLCLAPVLADDGKPAPQSCGGYGTSVDFLDNPSKAAKQAAREEKLVFVLHVSGNFEDSDFT